MNEGLQQKDVAELIGVKSRTYSQWEEGKNRPTGDNLKKLLELTELSVGQLAKIYVDAHPEGTPIVDEPNEGDLVIGTPNHVRKVINVIKNDVKEATEKKAKEPKPEEPNVNPKWPQNFIFGCISIRKDLAISTKDDWVHKELYSWLEAGKDNQYLVTHEGFTLREAQGIELYFKEFGHTFEDVGKSFGVTRERARQIILKAQRKFAYHIHLMLEEDARDRKIIQEELAKAEARSNREFTLEVKQDANGCPYTDDTPIKQAKITARDENGKPVAGRYIFEDSDGHAKLTREGGRKVAEYMAKHRSQLTAASMAEDFVKQKALNEPHDFRDEVIDEVLEKMYGQMDYKKYVYLVGLFGR